MRHPCKPLLIATYNPEEGTLRDHLLDRIAINLSADREWTDFKDRVDAVQRATEYQQTPEQMCEDMEEQSEGARTAITFAREYIDDVRIKPAQVKYLVTEAMRGAVQVNILPRLFPQRRGLLSGPGFDLAEASNEGTASAESRPAKARYQCHSRRLP